jgi:hypothetical protein
MSATVSDAGTHFIVSGASREAVEAKLAELAASGGKVLSPPAQVGAKWIATCENRRMSVRATVERLGMKSIVTAPTREAVDEKVGELVQFGARLEQPAECVDGVWTAVCDGPA